MSTLEDLAQFLQQTPDNLTENLEWVDKLREIVTTLDDEPTSFNVARAEKEGDSRILSVSDCLRETLRRHDGSWTKCVIVLYRQDPPNKFYTDIRVAGCSTLEARGLMTTMLAEELCP